MPAVTAEELPRGALTGKVAVVVGGASGIGRTVARSLARQGARVVIADFDVARMERTLEELLHLGTVDAALALPTDVRSDASVRSLAADAIKALGQIDVLVNMAGVLLQGPLDHIKASDWKWMLETNLLGTVRTTMAVLPHMLEHGSGHIINAVPAGCLQTTNPLEVPYDSGYAAVTTFTYGLAMLTAGRGVNVSLYATSSKAPLIGQNTRTRGMKRLLRPNDGLEEASPAAEQLADSLVEALHQPRFLVFADPADAASVQDRWGEPQKAEQKPDLIGTARK
jgi:NAD(P)-dependent dehydrogenase (short-subunit alcohol dehydrogenase family)